MAIAPNINGLCARKGRCATTRMGDALMQFHLIFFKLND